MVCLGNICRSPMAQGILEDKIKKYKLKNWEVDSAGTSGWHDGEAPDNRAIKAAKGHGIDISQQVSRKLSKKDFDYYDLILAMDSSNYTEIQRLCPSNESCDKVHLMLNYLHPNSNMAVPDPYYDGKFDEVFKLLDNGIESFIKKTLQKSQSN